MLNMETFSVTYTKALRFFSWWMHPQWESVVGEKGTVGCPWRPKFLNASSAQHSTLQSNPIKTAYMPIPKVQKLMINIKLVLHIFYKGIGHLHVQYAPWTLSLLCMEYHNHRPLGAFKCLLRFVTWKQASKMMAHHLKIWRETLYGLWCWVWKYVQPYCIVSNLGIRYMSIVAPWPWQILLVIVWHFGAWPCGFGEAWKTIMLAHCSLSASCCFSPCQHRGIMACVFLDLF